MKENQLNGQKLSVWAGVIAPVLFVLTFTLEGFLRPGYDPRAMYISALSLGSRGWVQVANFLQLGVLLLIFARGLPHVFSGHKAARRGAVLLTILGVLFLLSGPFVMDPDGTPQSRMSFHGLIHGLAGGIVFLLMPVTIWVFRPALRARAPQSALARWTLALGIFDTLTVLFFTIASKSPQLQLVFAGWFGLIQRTALVPFMVWLFLLGLDILSQNTKEKRNE
jgi:hypothetical membrane protein